MSLNLSELIQKYTAQIVISLLLLLATGVTAGVNLLFLAPLQKAGQGQILLQISKALLGMLSLSISYIVYLYIFVIRPKNRIQREFTFNEKIGTYTHKKTGQLYCGCCLLENIDSPLITLAHSWFCQRKGCSKEYRNPDNPPPPPQPQRRIVSPGVKSWVRDW
jgi:hypothetical protein